MSDPVDQWFVREILIHEAALTRFLARAWPLSAEVPDLRQEIYVRVYEAAQHALPAAPKSFLFATARHLLTDRIRRGRVVSMEAVEDLDALNVLVDEISPEQRLSARQELKRLAGALERLPARCRDVVWLRKVESLSQKEVARRLGITEGTVEKQVAKGIRFLTEVLYSRSAAAAQDEHVSSAALDASPDKPRPRKN